MKALVLKTEKTPQLVLQELAKPNLKINEVLVKVKAIGINPVDVFAATQEAGLELLQLKGEDPLILGWDISGVVTEIGSDVRNLKTGDEVFGMVNFVGHGKAYAEYVAAPAGQLALKPGNITHAEAAAACLAALSAWQSLVTYGKIKKGEKVLIHAAAGGVGHYAVQLAKSFGAYVIGVGSKANEKFIRDLGADEFIDYKTQVFEELVTDADLVLDSVWGDDKHIERSLHALKKGGRLISLLTFFSEPLLQKLKDKQVFGHRLGVTSNGNDELQIARLLANGELKSHVSKQFTFDQMAQAHQSVSTGRTVGKVVVTL